MHINHQLCCTFFTLVSHFIGTVHSIWTVDTEELDRPRNEDNAILSPLVIPLETRMLNLQKLEVSEEQFKKLINDCNSEAIIRAIRRPNVISPDTITLRICLSLLDVLHNAERNQKAILTSNRLLESEEIESEPIKSGAMEKRGKSRANRLSDIIIFD